MTRTKVPSDEPVRSELIEGIDRIREERLKKSKQGETEEAAVTRKGDLPPTTLP
jgi:hypothetical protein